VLDRGALALWYPHGSRPCAYASSPKRLGKYDLSAEWQIGKGHGDSFAA